ncbi:hypothetical protein [Pelagibaculum spongiae]|uniref:Uncharacterized protein n=1 Tax=Pelagibaculum spongiae TaxID=2080658 RepID=A0A2V1GZ06_9GAMM|nr:hypothetical protein [Pelagibaculum spongiae]PVZ72301.1 hypothetical protein DC094_04645 [Pelagibaculum spongiae]
MQSTSHPFEGILSVLLMIATLFLLLLASTVAFSLPIPFTQDLAVTLFAEGSSAGANAAKASIFAVAGLFASIMLLKK